MLAFADSLFSVIAHCNCTFTLCPDANRILSRIIPASPNCWQSPRLVLHCFIPNWPLASAAALVLFEHASAVASFCATPLDLHPSPFSQSTHPTLCQTPRVYSTLSLLISRPCQHTLIKRLASTLQPPRPRQCPLVQSR